MRRQMFPLVLWAAIAFTAASQAFAYGTPKPPPPSAASAAQRGGKPVQPKLVDLNKASRTELKTLPGIGSAEADMIIKNRPYMTKTGLVEKKVLTLEAYDKLHKQIVVVHKGPPPKPKS